MLKNSSITKDMLDTLHYDGELIIYSNNKKNELKSSKFLIREFSLCTTNLETAVNIITREKHTLANIELEYNCVPTYITLKNIDMVLQYFLKKRNFSSNICSSAITINASFRVAIFELLYDLLMAISHNCSDINFIFNKARENLVNYIMTKIFNGVCKGTEELPMETNKTNSNYGMMFIFASSDLDAAAHHLVASTEDITCPWHIESIYVQESCYELFCSLVNKHLNYYPPEIMADQIFMDNYSRQLNIIKSLKARILTFDTALESSIKSKPLICEEFCRDYFVNDSNNLPSVTTIKSIRTVKEAITLAKKEKARFSSIWSRDTALAYELVDNLNSSVFWLNCIGILNTAIPFELSDKNYIGSDFSMVKWKIKNAKKCQNHIEVQGNLFEFLKSGIKIENSYHFEYMFKDVVRNDIPEKFLCITNYEMEDYWKILMAITESCKLKTVVFPIGVTYSN